MSVVVTRARTKLTGKSSSSRRSYTDREGIEQQHIFDLAKTAYFQFGDEYKKLSDYLFAIPNGGKRQKAVAAKLKAQGVKAGVHDMFLPVPRLLSAGLWIELKVERNKPTREQLDWARKMAEQGYNVEIVWGWKAAVEAIEMYLGGLYTKDGKRLEVPNAR